MKPKIGFIGLGIMGQYMANSAFSLSLPLLVSFSTQNSSQSGEFHIEKPHFLDG